MTLLAEPQEMPVPASATGSRGWTPFAHPERATTALVGDGTSLTHAELAARVEDLAAHLPDVRTGRRLIHLTPGRDIASVVDYLAVHAAGHVALVTGTGQETITQRFRPDLRLTRGTIEHLSTEGQHLLHPDLALLLSTSGSTGSPKLVRLSRENLTANADAIVASLDLTARDRAITSLPLHYCYGLSLVHALLRVGGSLVVTDRSVTDEEFWREHTDHRVSLLAGVPHTFDLVDDRLRGDLPGLRLVTQAGGAMAPERVTELARLGRAKGWQLAVMYGQTEATARMAVLTGDDVLDHPDAVGRPVTDSLFRLDHDVPGGTPEVGELTFTGPGVMLGYAEHADDLALGRMVSELRTGDLGRITPEGLVRVVGRRDRVAKVMGLRLDLGRVAEALTGAGHDVVVTADARHLLVTLVTADTEDTEEAPTVGAVRALAAEASGLPAGAVVVDPVPALSRLSNGKVDRVACRDRALQRAEAASTAVADGDRLDAVLTVVAGTLGHDVGSIDPARSFTELGGDSYSLVQTSVRLERLLGPLPRGWHQRPLRQLTADATASEGRVRWLETPVVLRAASVLAICASHIGLVSWPGGAHVLLVIAGWSMARFTLASPDPEQQRRRGARALIALAVPAVLIGLLVRVAGGGYGWANVFLVNWLVGTVERGPRVQFWFIEALLACVVLVLALLAVPTLREQYQRAPWAWCTALAALALVPRWILIPDPTGSISGLPGSVLWLFAVGLSLGVATTTRQRLITLALTAVGMIGFFFDPTRGATVVAGVLVLALVPRVPVPRALTALVGLLATASLHIYLVQFQIYPHVDNGPLALVLCLTAGVATWALLDPPTRALTTRLVPLKSHPPQSEKTCAAAP